MIFTEIFSWTHWMRFCNSKINKHFFYRVTPSGATRLSVITVFFPNANICPRPSLPNDFRFKRVLLSDKANTSIKYDK